MWYDACMYVCVFCINVLMYIINNLTPCLYPYNWYFFLSPLCITPRLIGNSHAHQLQ